MSHLIADINLRELACLQKYGYHEVVTIPLASGGKAYWGQTCNRCKYRVAESKNTEPWPILWNPNGALGYEYWVWVNGVQYPKNDGTRLTAQTALELVQKGIHANICG